MAPLGLGRLQPAQYFHARWTINDDAPALLTTWVCLASLSAPGKKPSVVTSKASTVWNRLRRTIHRGRVRRMGGTPGIPVPGSDSRGDRCEILLAWFCRDFIKGSLQGCECAGCTVHMRLAVVTQGQCRCGVVEAAWMTRSGACGISRSPQIALSSCTTFSDSAFSLVALTSLFGLHSMRP